MASSPVTARPTACPYRRTALPVKQGCTRGSSRLGHVTLLGGNGAPAKGARPSLTALAAMDFVEAVYDSALETYVPVTEDPVGLEEPVSSPPVPEVTLPEDVPAISPEALATQADNIPTAAPSVPELPVAPAPAVSSPEVGLEDTMGTLGDAMGSFKEAAGSAFKNMSSAASSAEGVMGSWKSAVEGTVGRVKDGVEGPPQGGSIGGFVGGVEGAMADLVRAAQEDGQEISGFVGGVISPVEDAVEDLVRAVDGIKASASGGGIGAAALSLLPPSLVEGVKKLLEAGNAVSETGIKAAGTVGGVVDTLSRGDINSLAEGVKQSALTAIVEAPPLKAAQATLEAAVVKSQNALTDRVTSVTSSVDASVEGVRASGAAAAQAVDDAIGGTVGVAARALSDQVKVAAQYLPPEVAAAANEAATSASETAIQVVSDPANVAAILGALALPPLIGAVSNFVFARRLRRYLRGSVNTIDPLFANQYLKDDDALLVDIRPLEARRKTGIVEVRFGARFKAITLPEELAAKEAINAEGVAEVIRSSNKYKSDLTKVMILDDADEGTAFKLAMGLAAAGITAPFVIRGGFAEWRRLGVGVLADGIYTDYDFGLAQVMQDQWDSLTGSLASQGSMDSREVKKGEDW